MDIIYNSPLWLTFTLYVIFFTSISVIGLYLFNLLTSKCTNIYRDCFDVSTTMISIVSVFLGVSVSFLIVNVWVTRSAAFANDKNEAEAAYSLYKLFGYYGSSEGQQSTKNYLENVVNVEFPALNNGSKVDERNNFTIELRDIIYSLEPTTVRQGILLERITTQYDKMISSRINRLNFSTSSIGIALWILIIIYAVSLIFLSWLINCLSVIHYVVVAILAICVSSSVFVILIMTNPYRGPIALTTEPYDVVLNIIG